MQWRFINSARLLKWQKIVSNTTSLNFLYSLRLYFILMIPVLLSSCAHLKHDGPPDFYVDETKVHDAVPKIEPPSKYGNMTSYRVGHHRYFVMKSSKNYEEVGTASWYGTLFHHHRTSSGERYNMLGMTAAHRYLPLPTYVRVTNLHNQRSVIVKVNDRGPFHSNRLIDVSYVAAKKLGMIGHGTATVRVQAIDPAQYQHDIILAKQDAARADISPLNQPRALLAEKKSRPTKKILYARNGKFHTKKTPRKIYASKNNKIKNLRSHLKPRSERA